VTVTGGPRFTVRGKRTDLFFHGLIGVADAGVGFSGFSINADALTFGGGAGLNVRVREHIAIRAFEGDFVSAEKLGVFVDGFRLSTGVVFTFGGERQATPRQNSRTSDRSTTPVHEAASSEAPLLGVSGYAVENGFKISSVRSGSPAAQIALSPGDIVTQIDGREVHSNRDIEAAMAASTTGTIRVSCLTQTTAVGMVNTEREVKVR
jgi:hypothetical protein